MRALRYLLIVIGLVSVLSVHAQALYQLPEARMQSTSGMVGSGSTLPMAATSGVFTAGEAPSAYTPFSSNRPRRVGEDDDWEDEEEPTSPGEPFPLGDAAWPLMILALGYCVWRVMRQRKTEGTVTIR